MNRSHIARELARLLADRTESDNAVKRVFSVMAQALKNGESVVISGFGTFSPRLRPAHRARNPRTGESVVAAPRRAVRFKPSKKLLS